MCTMTWFVNQHGYQLFFNRDERVSRSRAELPTIQQAEKVQYLSPTDTEAGGTWIAANHFGVTVCLLNHYEFEQIATYKNWISRGEIVRRFAGTENLDDVERQIKQLDLHDFRAFRMFLIDRRGNNRLCVWDGHQVSVLRDVDSPKSSSSVDGGNVKTVRRQLFEKLNLVESQQPSDFVQYHSGHFPDRSKESVCMHREDAQTVSLSHVSVSESHVYFSYADGSPCEAELGPALKIDLQDGPSSDRNMDNKPVIKVANL